MKHVLVFGATGFIGSHIAEAFIAAGWRVTGVSRSKLDHHAYRTHLEADLTRPGAVEAIIADLAPDVIVQAAGLRTDFASQWSTGPALLGRVIAAIAARGAILIAIGSSGEYAPTDAKPVAESDRVEPLSRYAAIKAAESALATSAQDADVRVLRAFNPIGRRMATTLAPAAFAQGIARIKLGLEPPVLSVGDLSTVRDFFSARDVGSAAVAIAERGQRGTAYNCCSGVGHSVEELLRALIARSGVQCQIRKNPMLMRPAEIPAQVGDASMLMAETGWRPCMPWEKTIDDLWEDWLARTGASG